MALKFKVGDEVQIIRADAFPYILGRKIKVLHVGPWKVGDKHPTGGVCVADNDYLISDPTGMAVDGVLACREENLAPA